FPGGPGLLRGSLLRSPFLRGSARRLASALRLPAGLLAAGRSRTARRRLPRDLARSLAASFLLGLFLGGCLLARHTTRLQEQLHETGDYTYDGRKRKPAKSCRNPAGKSPPSPAADARRRPSCIALPGR